MKNKELLLKAKASILAEPEHFDMNQWISCPGMRDGEFLASKQEPDCGTTMCIGGWVAFHAVRDGAIKIKTVLSLDWGKTIAMRVLGLNEREAAPLFYSSRWPDDLLRRFDRASRPKTLARIAAERIDRFIAEMEAVNAE